MGKIARVEILPETVDIGLFISGSAAARNVICTCEQLEAQDKLQTQMFSVYDNHEDKESRHLEQGCGLPLDYYLTQAGIKDAEEIRTKSVDGFESVVSELKSGRYYFPGLEKGSTEGRELREALVSFYKNGEKVKFYPHPTIMFGQQGLEDKNKDFFAKGVRSIVVGGRDRAFWVKGDALACNRYFSMDQLFELEDERFYRSAHARLIEEDGKERIACAVCIPESFRKKQIAQTKEDARLFAEDAKGNKTELGSWEGLWLFFADEEAKTLGLYDGVHIIDHFSGFQVGEVRKTVKPKSIRTPSPKADGGDFYIRVLADKKKIARYDYTLDELKRDYSDAASEEVYHYYNHNMNGGRGGNRLVTAHGWLLAELLELLPEVPDRDFVESGGLLFHVVTRDTYKGEIALEGNELTAFQFMLAYEQDQRTETGPERGDTSRWEDTQKRFEPIRGNTPYRIYCKKSSANPAVYKNVEGITVELL